MTLPGLTTRKSLDQLKRRDFLPKAWPSPHDRQGHWRPGEPEAPPQLQGAEEEGGAECHEGSWTGSWDRNRHEEKRRKLKSTLSILNNNISIVVHLL